MPKERVEKKSRIHKEVQKEGRIRFSARTTNRLVVFYSSGINFNKEFGQHILKNPLIITNMVEKVGRRGFAVSEVRTRLGSGTSDGCGGRNRSGNGKFDSASFRKGEKGTEN